MKILLIEDDSHFLSYYTRAMEGAGHTVTCATNHKDAECRVLEKGWDIIVLDGCLNNNGRVDTLYLIPKIQEHCPGRPIIANSSFFEYGDQLVSMGCTHRAEKTTTSVMSVIQTLQ